MASKKPRASSRDSTSSAGTAVPATATPFEGHNRREDVAAAAAAPALPIATLHRGIQMQHMDRQRHHRTDREHLHEPPSSEMISHRTNDSNPALINSSRPAAQPRIPPVRYPEEPEKAPSQGSSGRKASELADLELVALMAFAMSLFMTGLTHVRALRAEAACLIAMLVMTGGLVMIVAALTEYMRDELFKTTMYYSYGCFWLAHGGPILFSYWGWGVPPDAIAKGLFSLIWGYFTILMAISVGVNYTRSKLLFPCFALLSISLLLQGLFDCLTASIPCSDIEWLSFIAGGCQVVAALIAFYVSCGSIVNKAYIDSVVITTGVNPSTVHPPLPMFERSIFRTKPLTTTSDPIPELI